MKLINLKANNLFSFEKIDLDLNNKGLVLVNGWDEDNDTHIGSGKSSLTSKAIPWILYGKSVSGLKADDVCRKDTNECWGEIEFISKNSKKYRITRFRPSKLILEEFNKDWHDISSRVQSETQEKIDQLLGKTFDAFLHTDFFGQGMAETFIHLSTVQQNTLFGFVVSLDRINELVDKTKKFKSSFCRKVHTP
ncbi:MAG: AAA family ATPase [Nanoarchaeota archaeon]